MAELNIFGFILVIFKEIRKARTWRQIWSGSPQSSVSLWIPALSTCSGFRWWWVGTCKPDKPSPPQASFGQCFVTIKQELGHEDMFVPACPLSWTALSLKVKDSAVEACAFQGQKPGLEAGALCRLKVNTIPCCRLWKFTARWRCEPCVREGELCDPN